MEGGARIKTLKLSNNQIGDDGMKHIAALLRNRPTLTTLHLDGNQIGDDGVQQVAKALTHRQMKLERLYLHKNKNITDRSFNHLRNIFIENHKLKSI